MSIEELPESKLGTKEHWDQVYEREINSYKNLGDPGEVWFGLQAEKKMLSWLHSHFPPPSSSLSSSSSSPSILDVGSGNGHFLHILAGKKGGYDGRKMVGVDYSEGSVSLSQLIGRDLGEGRRPEGWEDSDDSESEEEDEEDAGGKGTEGEVRFEWGDVLSDVGLTEIEVPLGEEGWDVVTDKGTYDAVSLSPHPIPPSNLPPSELYPKQIPPLLKKGGFFLITSCNFTEEEIKLRFSKPEELGLVYHSRMKHPSFRFGGSQGTTVCTVAFQKI